MYQNLQSCKKIYIEQSCYKKLACPLMRMSIDRTICYHRNICVQLLLHSSQHYSHKTRLHLFQQATKTLTTVSTRKFKEPTSFMCACTLHFLPSVISITQFSSHGNPQKFCSTSIYLQRLFIPCVFQASQYLSSSIVSDFATDTHGCSLTTFLAHLHPQKHA